MDGGLGRLGAGAAGRQPGEGAEAVEQAGAWPAVSWSRTWAMPARLPVASTSSSSAAASATRPSSVTVSPRRAMRTPACATPMRSSRAAIASGVASGSGWPASAGKW
ncbi:hypothetical protein ACFQY5_20690 [Paeniroseomonas aquatica]|uniref:hypothetical protein n=1 Tax=Paeniroseomonas aquatica TaxID=373043 RepID=UPI003605C921